ncbi:MAG: LytTR family transcriptional regulator DNA-binding domain-containing protein [Prevotella sp.]|nr:LytTR family transcriptional regulator DNA-binding domain-containing protein [Prevotella sp.]
MKKIKYLYLNSRDEFFRVDVSKIVYFEADGNYTNFMLSNKLKGVVLMNLTQMKDTLSNRLKEQASIFARVGKRFIINLSYVYHIDVSKQRLTLTDGEKFAYNLPISKDALKKLKDLFLVSVANETKSKEHKQN